MSQAVQNVVFGFSIKTTSFFFPPGLVHNGLAPISSSSGGRGLTNTAAGSIISLALPSFQVYKKLYNTSGRWDVTAVEVPSNPSGIQWRNEMKSPTV